MEWDVRHYDENFQQGVRSDQRPKDNDAECIESIKIKNEALKNEWKQKPKNTEEILNTSSEQPSEYSV